MALDWTILGNTASTNDGGGPIMQRVRADLENVIKATAAGTTCPEHDERPTVTFLEWPGKLAFEVTGCCREFEQEVIRRLT